MEKPRTLKEFDARFLPPSKSVDLYYVRKIAIATIDFCVPKSCSQITGRDETCSTIPNWVVVYWANKRAKEWLGE